MLYEVTLRSTTSLPSLYIALLLPTSKFECLLNGQTDRPILPMLYKVTLRSTHKIDVDGIGDTPRLQQNIRREKKWLLRGEFFKMKS
jgi:hypothetical protein